MDSESAPMDTGASGSSASKSTAAEGKAAKKNKEVNPESVTSTMI